MINPLTCNGFQTRKTRETIRCLVPAAPSPGPVDVWILVEPLGSVPEIDCRTVKFTYEDKRMTEWVPNVNFVRGYLLSCLGLWCM